MSSPNQNEASGNTGAPENDQEKAGYDVDMSQQQQVEVHFDSPVRRNLPALTSDSDFVLSAASSVETTPTPTAFLGHSPDDAALAMAAGLIHSGTNAAPFGSPQGLLSGENIDLSNSFQQPTPAHSLVTSPYNPSDDDESDAITPITNNKIRLGTGGLGVGELSHGIQVPLHALGPPNMPVIDEQNSNMDSPPAESVVSGRLNNNELSPPVLDSASVASKSFVEDDVSRNSGSIGIGGGNGGIRPRRGRVRSWDHAHSGAANNDMFMTGLQQPQLDDVPEETSFGGGVPPFRGGGEGVPPVGLGGPPPHPLAASAGVGGIGRNNPNRPPRAPPLPPQPRPHGHHVGSVQFSHRRGASLGDHSILSVLTESSLEEGDAGTGSRRRTSWDFDASPRLPPMSILQPVLSEGNLMGLDFEAESESAKETEVGAKQTLLDLPVFTGTPAPTVPPGAEAGANTNDNPMPPQLQSPPGREMEFSHSTETYATTNTAVTKENRDSKDDSASGDLKGMATKVITVTDVSASPHEEEAETSILKAIEQRDSERKAKERRSISKTSMKVAGMNDSEAERAASAFAENENAKGGRESAKQHNENVQSPSQVPPKNATRNAGNKMVELTEQLMMMQTMNISIRGKGGHRTEHGDQLISPEEFSPPTSSSAYFGVDALANDGAQLFRRSKHRKQHDSSAKNGLNETTARAPTDDEGARTAQMRWGMIRGVVLTSSAANKKKVDEESDGGGDIEDQREKTSQEHATADDVGAPDHGNCARNFRDKGRRELREIGHAVKEEVSPKKGRILLRAKWFLAIVLPSLLVASVLFYALKNPLVCTAMEEGDPCASWSWWIIFVGIRQPITLVAARVVEVFAVNIFSLRTRITLRMWGPFITLWIVQSKGWPALLTIWAIVDFIVLYGRSKWTNHWLFWQHVIDMCNANNPAGLVLDSSTYTRVLSAGVTAGVLTGLKRLWLSSYLGTRTCGKFLMLASYVDVAPMIMNLFFSLCVRTIAYFYFFSNCLQTTTAQS